MTSSNPKIRVDAKRVGNETTNSAVVFIFSRTGTSSSQTHLNGDLEINYELFGTAQKGVDYSDQKEGTITIDSGKSTAELSLDVLSDSVFDPGETISIKILPSSNYEISPGGQITKSTITAEGMHIELNKNNFYNTGSGINNTFQETNHVNAFSIISTEGVNTWGETQAGGWSYDADFNGPNDDLYIREIFSKRNAFAALRSDGHVVTWGYGTGVSDIDFDGPNDDLVVKDIFSTYEAFAALRSDGSVVSWGGNSYGGYGGDSTNIDFDGPNDDLEVDIFSTVDRFALRSDGSVVSGGYSGDTTYEWDEKLNEINLKAKNLGIDDYTNIIEVSSNDSGYAAIKTDGSVITSSSSSHLDFDGQNNDLVVSEIYSNKNGFAFLRSDCSVLTLGSDSSNVDFDGTNNNSEVIDIFSTSYAFAALRSDGSVVTWGGYGSSNYGEDSGSVDLSSGIIDLSSTWSSFAALKSDGSVVGVRFWWTRWGFERNRF